MSAADFQVVEAGARQLLLKLDGYTNEEIATQLGLTRRTIQRMFVPGREKWSALIQPRD
ncbi:MAG: helix-turn-helix domain-containing protein [Planctomycetota bacterium]|nr:helix-turn-helix domain-containing protein [Planctomycetota bacterium]